MTGRQRAVEAVRGGIMQLLMPLERRELRLTANVTPKVCFVLGPPRSGTTLLYELLLTRFRFAYFSNLAHRFYRTPVAASRLGLRWT